MENNNQPAFPRPKQILGSGEDYHEIPAAEGLTKREWFAGMALQGFISNSVFFQGYSSNSDMARQAVDMADNLLSELQNLSHERH